MIGRRDTAVLWRHGPAAGRVSRRAALGMVGAALATSARAADGSVDLDRLGRTILSARPAERAQALAAITARSDPDMLATLLLAMRHGPGPDLDLAAAALTGARDRKGWFDWMVFQEGRPDIVPHPSYAPLKLALLASIDPAFLRFFKSQPIGRERMRIRLEEITWGGVRVDGIPSLDRPQRIAAADADYLEPDDLVFGISIDGDARAYPLRIMGWHEMFNEVIGGVPVALAYCTLCGAGILFETKLAGRDEPFTFGSSGLLYRSNKLMFDRQTESLWNQFTGQPVVGPLADSGIALKQRPVVITGWQQWRAGNPETTVLSLATGHRRDYGAGVVYRDYFASPDLMFPAIVDQGRLAQKDFVFGVRVPLGAKAWPMAAFAGGRVINDRVGTTALAVIGDAQTRTVRAYDRGDFTFTAAGEGLRDEAGRAWRLTEEALQGPAGGRRPRVAGHIAYWFAWNSYLGLESELWSER